MKIFAFFSLAWFFSMEGFPQPSAEQLNASGQKVFKTVHLYNGLDFEGWYTFLKDRGRNNDPKKVFTISDGMIRISGEEWGCITTKEEFENYRLTIEFKWGVQTFSPRLENARDCGILLHSIGEDGGSDGTWMRSIECQIIEGGTGDFIVVGDGTDKYNITCPVAGEKQGYLYVFQPGGRPETIHKDRINWFARDPNWKDVKSFRGQNDVEKPLGEWNTLECVASGGEISIYLNGILVNYAFDVRPNKGRIQIQSEGAEIFFRRVELESLSKK